MSKFKAGDKVKFLFNERDIIKGTIIEESLSGCDEHNLPCYQVRLETVDNWRLCESVLELDE